MQFSLIQNAEYLIPLIHIAEYLIPFNTYYCIKSSAERY